MEPGKYDVGPQSGPYESPRSEEREKTSGMPPKPEVDKMSLAYILNPMPPTNTRGEPVQQQRRSVASSENDRQEAQTLSLSVSDSAQDGARDLLSPVDSRKNANAAGSSFCGKNRPRRKVWTPQEDELLRRIVTTSDGASWQKLADIHMPYRTGQQLRARWVYYISTPGRMPQSFTPQQDALILRLVEAHGGWWGMIARQLNGEFNDQEVKFRYRKLRRAIARAEASSASSRPSDSARPHGPSSLPNTADKAAHAGQVAMSHYNQIK